MTPTQAQFLKFGGLFCDIVGTVLIATAVIKMNPKSVSGVPLAQLEVVLKKDIKSQRTLTIVGLLLIVIGFVMIFSELFYSTKHAS